MPYHPRFGSGTVSELTVVFSTPTWVRYVPPYEFVISAFTVTFRLTARLVPAGTLVACTWPSATVPPCGATASVVDFCGDAVEPTYSVPPTTSVVCRSMRARTFWIVKFGWMWRTIWSRRS